MNESGISVSEACAKRAEIGSGYLTDEDFANQCNPDGTVKQSNESTTLTIKNTDSSATINNTYLYIISAVAVVVLALLFLAVMRRKTKRS